MIGVEEDGGEVVDELCVIFEQVFFDVGKDFGWYVLWEVWCLVEDWCYCIQQCCFGYVFVVVVVDVVGYVVVVYGEVDQGCVLQVQFVYQFGQVIGEGVVVVIVLGLVGMVEIMVVIGDDVIVVFGQEVYLVFLYVVVQWLVVVEDDWLVVVLVFVIDFGVVVGSDGVYGVIFCEMVWRGCVGDSNCFVYGRVV